jgi:hypothetical protein
VCHFEQFLQSNRATLVESRVIVRTVMIDAKVACSNPAMISMTVVIDP